MHKDSGLSPVGVILAVLILFLALSLGFAVHHLWFFLLILLLVVVFL